MATISQHFFNNIAQYLQLPLGKITQEDNLFIYTHKNHSWTGVINIIIYMLKEANSNLVAQDIIQEAQIRQWLEYSVVYVGNAYNNQNCHHLLKDLNIMLSTKTFLVGNRFTIADVALFYGLFNIMSNLSNLDKEKYLNLSRWFDNIQQDPLIRPKNNTVDFSTNYLANLVPARH